MVLICGRIRYNFVGSGDVNVPDGRYGTTGDAHSEKVVSGRRYMASGVAELLDYHRDTAELKANELDVDSNIVHIYCHNLIEY